MLLMYLQERELGDKKKLKYIIRYTLYTKMMCKIDHIYGYSPHTCHGKCRFCLRDEPLTFPEFIKKITS